MFSTFLLISFELRRDIINCPGELIECSGFHVVSYLLDFVFIGEAKGDAGDADGYSRVYHASTAAYYVSTTAYYVRRMVYYVSEIFQT
jgi:hypothetical protein